VSLDSEKANSRPRNASLADALNNAILLNSPDGDAAAAATELMSVYADAGVDVWAFWVPSATSDRTPRTMCTECEAS
jgi:hypothetical protein